MVSKAVLFAVTVTVGLLVPAPTVLRSIWRDAPAPRPVALLSVERISRTDCPAPPEELRFEMLPKDAEVAPPPGTQAVCRAVYRVWEDAAQP